MRKIKKTLVDKLELPAEVLLFESKITIYGKHRMVVTGHEGIRAYTNDRVELLTKDGLLQVSGNDFVLRNYGKDDVIIDGKVDGFWYGVEKA